MMDRHLRSYALLLTIQTACGIAVLADIHANTHVVFSVLIENIGVPHSSSPETLLPLLIAVPFSLHCFTLKPGRLGSAPQLPPG